MRLGDDISRCHGRDTAVKPGVPLPLCRNCLRRTDVAFGREYWWIAPAAKDDGREWTCENRIEDDFK